VQVTITFRSRGVGGFDGWCWGRTGGVHPFYCDYYHHDYDEGARMISDSFCERLLASVFLARFCMLGIIPNCSVPWTCSPTLCCVFALK
jgi:hypothetical protein